MPRSSLRGSLSSAGPLATLFFYKTVRACETYATGEGLAGAITLVSYARIDPIGDTHATHKGYTSVTRRGYRHRGHGLRSISHNCSCRKFSPSAEWMLVSGTRYFEGEGMAHVLIISAGIGGMPTAFVALPQILQRNVNWFLIREAGVCGQSGLREIFPVQDEKGHDRPGLREYGHVGVGDLETQV